MNNDEIKVILLFKNLKENKPDIYEQVKRYLETKYFESQNIIKD